ncbi:hypothetical protein NDU88_000727, partial [Pleurodeles waltl]
PIGDEKRCASTRDREGDIFRRSDFRSTAVWRRPVARLDRGKPGAASSHPHFDHST